MRRTGYFIVGWLLMLTGGLKLVQVVTDPFADLRNGYSISTLLIIGAIELGHAFALFLLRPGVKIWSSLAILFTAFLAVSSISLMYGRADCGCAGPLKLPTWIFLILDVTVLYFLWINRPGAKEFNFEFRTFVRGINWSFVVGAAAAIGIATSAFKFDVFPGIKPTSTRSSPGGLALRVPSRFLVDELSVGRVSNVVVKIENLTDNNTELVGFKKSCSCLSLGQIGSKVPAFSGMEVFVQIEPRIAGQFHERLILYFDHPDQPLAEVNFFGVIPDF